MPSYSKIIALDKISPGCRFESDNEEVESDNESLQYPLLPAHLVPHHDEAHGVVSPEFLQLSGDLQVRVCAAHQS